MTTRRPAAQVDAGRYLAGDWGATFALDRRFANGWKIGAFFTLTNVSAARFGEGSFDKGIRMTIPLSWITGKPARSACRVLPGMALITAITTAAKYGRD